MPVFHGHTLLHLLAILCGQFIDRDSSKRLLLPLLLLHCNVDTIINGSA